MNGPAARCWAALLLATAAGECGNRSLVSGVYAATLGAGGATAAERSAFGQNPAALRPGWMGMRLDFHRPYGMEGLEVAEAGIFADAARWGISAEWRQTGVDDLYLEQGFQVAQSIRFGAGARFPGSLDLGAAWGGWRSQWPDGRRAWEWDHGLGAVWRPFRRLRAGAFVLGLPLDPGGPAPRDRVVQWGLAADSRDPEAARERRGMAETLRLDFRRTGAAPWRTMASLSLSPHPCAEITGGLGAPPFQASLGARISWAGWDWRQALRYHRFLGRTWLSGLAYSRVIGVTEPD